MNTPIFGYDARGGRALLAIVVLGSVLASRAFGGVEQMFPPFQNGMFTTDWYRAPGPDFSYQLEKLTQDRRNPTSPPLRFPVRGPLLGQPLPPLPEEKVGEAVSRMQPFLAEPFFAPLSVLLAEGAISEKRAEMLEQYRTMKQQAVKRLSAELDATRAARPAERFARLALFARSQAAEVEDVEERAEAIRLELFKTRFFEGGVDWAGARGSQRADRTPKTAELDQLEMLQLGAAFGPELSPEQRGLLQEAAMEIVDRSHGITADSLLSFTPSNSRIRLPDRMPETLARRVAAYRALKGTLMEELRTAVFAQSKSGEHERTVAFKALREAQAGGIAKLEMLAEEIRVDLVGCPLPAAPPTSPIPTSLAPRIADYLDAKVQAQRAFVVKLAEVRAAMPQAQADVVAGERGYRIEVDLKGAPVGAGSSVLDSLPAFHEVQTRRYAELVAKRKALVLELQAVPSNPLQTGDRSVDELLHEFVAAQAQQETWNKYQEYRNAVLEPGLSAAQRRILFSTAVETLVGPYYR